MELALTLPLSPGRGNPQQPRNPMLTLWPCLRSQKRHPLLGERVGVRADPLTKSQWGRGDGIQLPPGFALTASIWRICFSTSGNAFFDEAATPAVKPET